MSITKMPAAEFVAELKAALSRKDGYIMGATGQNPQKWSASSWWFTQYSGSQKTKALYWREHAARVWDCNGLAEGIYKDYTGTDINTKARYNYSQWCDPKGSGLIPAEYRVPGAAVFWGEKASTITHVAYLVEPVDPDHPEADWKLIEARGVNYGVVETKLLARKPQYWGLMTKYFDYSGTPVPEKPDPEPDPEFKPGTKVVTITGNSVNIRVGDSTKYKSLGYAYKGNRFEYVATSPTGWNAIRYQDCICWVSDTYSTVETIK